MKKLFIVVCALSFFLFYAHAKEHKKSLLEGLVMVLDAGHGGLDQGANCVEGSEAEINLKIVKKLQTYLQQYGAKVILTRDGDYDLASKHATNRKKEDFNQRMKLIQDNNADLLISIHANSFASSSVSGIQLFYQENNEMSQKLCKTMHQHLQKVNERVLKDKVGDYFVLKKSGTPSVLVECGFLSNAKDRELLFQEDYQDKIANQICKAIVSFFSFLD